MSALSEAADKYEGQPLFYANLKQFVSQHTETLLSLQHSFEKHTGKVMRDAASDVIELQLGANSTSPLFAPLWLPPRHKELRTSLADVLGVFKIDHQPFYRTLLCFLSLSIEMQSLTREAEGQYLSMLALVADGNCRGAGISIEEAQNAVGQLLMCPLQDLWAWQRRVTDVVIHVIQQLGAVCFLDPLSRCDGNDVCLASFSETFFGSVWSLLVELLGVIVALEELIRQNTVVLNGAALLLRRSKQLLAVASDKASGNSDFECDEGTILSFGHVLQRIQSEVLSEGILEAIGDAVQGLATTRASEMASEPFKERFADALEHFITVIEQALRTPHEISHHRQILGVTALFLLYVRLFGAPISEIAKSGHDADRRGTMCTRLYDLCKNITVVCLQGPHVMSPALWLVRRMPEVVKLVTDSPPEEVIESVNVELQRRVEQFFVQLNQRAVLVRVWMAEMQSLSEADYRLQHVFSFVDKLTSLILRGFHLAQELRSLLVMLIVLHHGMNTAIPSPLMEGIAYGARLLVMVRSVYHNKLSILGSSFNLLVETVGNTMEKRLYHVHCVLTNTMCAMRKKSLDSLTIARLETRLSAVDEAIVLLRRPQTNEGLIALSITLDVAFTYRQSNLCSDLNPIDEESRDDILALSTQLDRVVRYQSNLCEVTDCSFLFWIRESIFPLCFRHYYKCPSDAHGLPYLAAILQDCQKVAAAAKHVPCQLALDTYNSFVWQCLSRELVEPLCIGIENELRLCAHDVASPSQPPRALQLGEGPIRDLAQLTRMGPFRIFDTWIDLAAQAEAHLSRQFYDLNALAPGDWREYGRMREGARERYGLAICDGCLPSGVTDQGLDILTLGESIEVFIAHYTYNLTGQLFIQRPSCTHSKYLRSLSIYQVADSICVHGAGIVNITINHVYKCIIKKIPMISNFLRNDIIRSRLAKEEKFVLEQRKGSQEPLYPFARAQHFMHDIQELSSSTNTKSPYLELFITLISQVGNALGFVRMVHSSSLRSIADAATLLVPMAQEVAIADDLASTLRRNPAGSTDREVEASPNTTSPPAIFEAAANVDSATLHIKRSLREEFKYFRILIETISRHLRCADKHSHLRLFHLIVPLMCLSHVEHMVCEKEQLLRKSGDALFTDDGFALGCTFLLALFGVVKPFESLRWFDAVRQHHASRIQDVREDIERWQICAQSPPSARMRKYCDNDAEEVNNMYLLASTLELFSREWVGLEEAFVSSTVFFSFERTPHGLAIAPSAARPLKEDGKRPSVRSKPEGREEQQTERMLRVSYFCLHAMTPHVALRILALSPSEELTVATIKKAYIKQTLQVHPDLNPDDPDANSKFRNLSDALHVALKALEVRKKGTALQCESDTNSMLDSQAALESLRRALVAYSMHKESAQRLQTEDAQLDRTTNSNVGDAFFYPSLEHVTSVCRQEALAMRRVSAFCEELPEVLCGSCSTALFDAVAFFHTRYVETMAKCVMRFAKNLPIIVRRVVHSRRKHICNRVSPATRGFGTGKRPLEQRFEDMSMKPLVLMGALIFDVPVADGDCDRIDWRRRCGSTCGALCPQEVCVTEELKCVIYPSDSIIGVATKLSQWEAASYERLKLELAIVDVCTHFANTLIPRNEDANEHFLSFSVRPRLDLAYGDSQKPLEKLQKLLCSLCEEFAHDDPAMHADTLQAELLQIVDAECDSVPCVLSRDREVEEGNSLSPERTPQLVTRCRQLSALVAPYVEGGIVLRWRKPAESTTGAREDAGKEGANREGTPLERFNAYQRKGGEGCLPIAAFEVRRHRSCCTAESIKFAVSVGLGDELAPFLLAFTRALERVFIEAKKAERFLPALLEVRRRTTQEEFIPLEIKGNAAEEGPQYRYRGPIHCFPRLYNMETSQELAFWRLLHVNREYVAKHAASIRAFNVFFECTPYDHKDLGSSSAQPMAEAVAAGWYDTQGDDFDAAVLTATQLKSAAAFCEWLEDVVEQSAMNKEAQRVLDEAGVGYVHRDPALPLANYLSFTKVFVQSVAVRAILECRKPESFRVMSSEDIGLSIVVGLQCDVRDGGRLLVPWYLDPNVLLALLGEIDIMPALTSSDLPS